MKLGKVAAHTGVGRSRELGSRATLGERHLRGKTTVKTRGNKRIRVFWLT